MCALPFWYRPHAHSVSFDSYMIEGSNHQATQPLNNRSTNMLRTNTNISHLLLSLLVVAFVLATGCAQQAAVSKDEAPSAHTNEAVTGELEYRLSATDITIDKTAELLATRLSRAQLRAQLTMRGESTILVSITEPTNLTLAELRSIIESPGELRFQPVDEETSEAFFKGLSEELPQGFAWKVVEHGRYSITHTDVDALRALFEDQKPETGVMGYAYHPTFVEQEDQLVIGREPRYLDGENTFWASHVLVPEAGLTGAHLREVSVQIDTMSDRPYIALHFTVEGGQLLSEITAASLNQQLAIIVEDEIISAPLVLEPVTNGKIMLSLPGPGTTRQLIDEAVELEARIQSHRPLPIEFVAQR